MILNGISILIKRDLKEFSQPFHHVSTQWEDSHPRTGSDLLPDITSAIASILDLQPLEL